MVVTAGKSPFVCTHRTTVAGTVGKLVHLGRIMVHFFVLAGTVSKSSGHDATIKIGVIFSLHLDQRIQVR